MGYSPWDYKKSNMTEPLTPDTLQKSYSTLSLGRKADITILKEKHLF